MDRITQDAAEWFVASRDDTISGLGKGELARWLAESPVHVREYLAVAERWGTLKSAGIWPEDSRESLLATLRAAGTGKVIELESAALQRHPPRARWRSRRGSLAACIAILLPLAMVLSWWLHVRGDVYQTARGEQRSVVLRDGSVVQLNTLTRMIVHFDKAHRRIELPQGEAFFRVAHDTSRPFDVETPSAVVRAVGTEFNVYARAEGTQVAVVGGKVEVAARAPIAGPAKTAPDVVKLAPAPIPLKAHEAIAIVQASAAGKAIAPRPLANADTATAWIQRKIVFDNERVDEAAAEFNRYNQVQLRVADADLAGLRISGVFSADEPMVLVKYLEQIQHVKAMRHENVVMLGSRD